MESFKKDIISTIQSLYDSFTSSEKQIADFFIKNKDIKNLDLSSKNLSSSLYVSMSSLSRFSKKCGFNGYREFVYNYKNSIEQSSKFLSNYSKNIFNIYQEILNENYNIFDEKKIDILINLLNNKKKVIIYGKGSSGITANEFKLRFLSLGLDVDAIVDSHLMKVFSAVSTSNTLVIGISISGETKEIISALKLAKEKEATVVFITSNKLLKNETFFDELILVSFTKELKIEKLISPQFPLLILIDILYSKFLYSSKYERQALQNYTSEIVEREFRQDKFI